MIDVDSQRSLHTLPHQSAKISNDIVFTFEHALSSGGSLVGSRHVMIGVSGIDVLAGGLFLVQCHAWVRILSGSRLSVAVILDYWRPQQRWAFD